MGREGLRAVIAELDGPGGDVHAQDAPERWPRRRGRAGPTSLRDGMTWKRRSTWKDRLDERYAYFLLRKPDAS